jgi:hypothetical protein
MDLAQDCVKWRTVVPAVLNLLLPESQFISLQGSIQVFAYSTK